MWNYTLHLKKRRGEWWGWQLPEIPPALRPLNSTSYGDDYVIPLTIRFRKIT
jgi:hypothetical protein